MDAWTNFSETFDWLSGARSTQNSLKQVFRISLQFFAKTLKDELDVYAFRTS